MIFIYSKSLSYELFAFEGVVSGCRVQLYVLVLETNGSFVLFCVDLSSLRYSSARSRGS